jgi:hypothetical protein
MASPGREALCASLGEQPMDVCFHPSRALVAAGLITGAVELFPYTATSVGAVVTHALHAESCRSLRFLPDGATLASVGADCALVFADAETGARTGRVADAHAAAINRLAVISQTVLATGARARSRGSRGRRRRMHAAAAGGCRGLAPYWR